MHKITVSRFAAVVIGAAVLLFVENGYAEQSNTAEFHFAHPDRIRFDKHSLIIDGKPTFIFSGELHYFRCPRELWKERMQQMKDAGLNCIDTYLAWNLHEPEEPANPDDSSKLRDMEQIGDFIQTAQDLELYVILRPGPYICAEVDRGGLPGWLMKYRPEDQRLGQFLRGNSPEMLAWDRHWLAAAAKVVKPHLITNVPKDSTGVILWQLENEYDWNGAGLTSDVRADVLLALARASVDNGIDVPMFTCETMDEAFHEDPFLRTHVFDTVNKYPNYDMQPLIDGIAGRAKYQPEVFLGVTELQGGWFSQVGGSLSGGHNAAQITQVTLTAIERGCTMINYYMFYGGSNFGYCPARTVTQTYDYNAPLREWGGQEDRYDAVKAIGQMLQEHGQQLIHSEPVELTIKGDHKDVSIYLRHSVDGSQFYFLRNSQEHEPRSGTVSVQTKERPQQDLSYNLDNFEAKVLYVPPGSGGLAGGQWLPQPVERPEVSPSASAQVPAPVPVRIVSTAREKPADRWYEAPTGKHLPSAGIFDQRYVHYRVKFNLNAGDIESPLALFVHSDGGGDSLPVYVNGTEVPAAKEGHIPLKNLVHEGANTAVILFENLGCPNFGAVIELEQGITQISLVPQAARSHALEGWRMKLVTAEAPVAQLEEVGEDFDDHKWQRVRLTDPAAITPAGKSVVYRTTLPMPLNRLDSGVALTFPVIDDSGILFVNGQDAGRASDWSHPWTFDITKYLHEGENSIALLVHNDWGDGGALKGCSVDPIGRVLSDVQVSTTTSVDEEPLDGDQHRGLLVRYTMEFQLPRTPAALSVPWKLHLEADANAFVTLNGHLLGRYWSVGPQRDIWLPECWLNFDPDAKNVLELQARPTVVAPVDKIIKRADVLPYVEPLNVTSSAP